MKSRFAGWFWVLVTLFIVALSAAPAWAQGYRRAGALRPASWRTMPSFSSAYYSQLGARNPYFTYNNQLQMMQASAARGGVYFGSLQSQALMNSLAAQTYGTNYGIPFNYSTVANYYAPYFAPSYYPVYPSYYPYYPAPIVNPYAAAAGSYP